MADLILPDEAHANDPGHIPDHNLLTAAIQTVNTDLEAVETELGSNPSGTYSTVADRLAISDRFHVGALYPPPGAPVWADEFDTGSLGVDWTRMDYSGDAGHLTWTATTQGLLGVHNTTADGVGGRMHGLVRTLTGAGGVFSAGDALVTAVTYSGLVHNYAMIGVGITNGTTHGTSTCVQASNYWSNYRVNINVGLNADSGTSTGYQPYPTTPIYMRFVMTAANTWRADASSNGIDWVAGNTVSYTLTPTHLGFFVSNWTVAKNFTCRYHFIRRYSGVS